MKNKKTGIRNLSALVFMHKMTVKKLTDEEVNNMIEEVSGRSDFIHELIKRSLNFRIKKRNPALF